MTADPSFTAIQIAVLTVSDTRTLEEDKSGALLARHLTEAGHKLYDRSIAADDIYQVRAIVSKWIADSQIDAVITTGGTGITGRDSTPEAIAPLLDKQIDGFGELFRYVSYQEIGTSALQSRALAGVANGTFIFVLPGSSSACKTAWVKLIQLQLDGRTRPCNLTMLMPRLREH